VKVGDPARLEFPLLAPDGYASGPLARRAARPQSGPRE
jgi:hypothetical protein